MYATVLSFEHLRQAEEERLTRELEYRRLERERGDHRTPAAAGVVRGILRRLRRPAHAAPSVVAASR